MTFKHLGFIWHLDFDTGICLEAFCPFDGILKNLEAIPVFFGSQPCPLRVLGAPDMVFRMRHQAENPSRSIADTGDILFRAVWIVWITGSDISRLISIVERYV